MIIQNLQQFSDQICPLCGNQLFQKEDSSGLREMECLDQDGFSHYYKDALTVCFLLKHLMILCDHFSPKELWIWKNQPIIDINLPSMEITIPFMDLDFSDLNKLAQQIETWINFQ